MHVGLRRYGTIHLDRHGLGERVSYLSFLAKDLDYLKCDDYERPVGELNQIRRVLTVLYKRVRQVPEALNPQQANS